MKNINLYKVVITYYDRKCEIIIVNQKSNLNSLIERTKSLKFKLISVYQATCDDNGIVKFKYKDIIVGEDENNG